MAKHDIFICFSSKDETQARRVVSFLEENGVRCWISLRDVEPGQNYQESIVRAIEAARVVVFLFSENSSRSAEITKELSLAASEHTAVIPLRLSALLPSGALRYELATRQWIDAFPALELAFDKLLTSVGEVLRHSHHPHHAGAGSGQAAGTSPETMRSPVRAEPQAPILVAGTAQFEAVRALLAKHIGPIAKIIIQKASSESKSLDDFCERLGASLQNPGDRAAFLQAVKAQLAAKT